MVKIKEDVQLEESELETYETFRNSLKSLIVELEI